VGDREVTALDDFSRQAAQLKSGGAVMLTLKRGGSNRTVTLENRPAGYPPKP